MKEISGKVLLMTAASKTITGESRVALPLESGGILLGYREDQHIVITDALVIKSVAATTRRYVRDDVAANVQLRTFLESRSPDDPVGYIGEWHSHPGPSQPSRTDIQAIRSTAQAAIGPVALMVCSALGEPQFCAVIATRRRFGRISAQEAEVDIIEPPQQSSLGGLPVGAVRGDGPVFISYRQSDGTSRSSSLEGLLRAAGLVVWRDRSDLRPGTTTDRLEQALTTGLSAGVLVVTPDIAASTIVKDRELPRLIQLDQDARFSLCIANEVPRADDSKKPDYAAPDRLLGLAPASTLGDKKQSNSRTVSGRLEIVRDLLMHRIEQRKEEISTSGRALTVHTQTRTEPFALDAGEADLHVRIKPPKRGKLPSRQGLVDLKSTLPLTSDAIRAAGSSTVRIAGGMHLSVAFAIGAALPETKIGHVEVVDLRGQIWTSKADGEAAGHTIATVEMSGEFKTDRAAAKVAVFVTLTENADETAFGRLLVDQSGFFKSAARISVDPVDQIDSREAASISRQIAMEIKRLSSMFGRAEIHLAFHGPYSIAVLIGRYLNTVRTVVYEWDNPENGAPRYTPVMTLDSGVTGGPITKVHL
ncbi:integrative and conjugative element protein (TIGR02256 family) [Arthrobacter pascens]|uniref:SAVED domain-containing protein n=1 Tax=Arthrobacter pascens TaxID=1677 RepID=UPI002859B643|nr:SAVED domain-containing protein [Arthrobacter pascens]MDR6556843.1 integrative and conjugative element protein (TIGR02256 family) [Arthrobacter pascens]